MDKNIKVMFIDIDGTLTNSNNQVTKENSIAIKEAKNNGIMAVLCSGRGKQYAVEKSIEANASNYVILNNGSQVYDYDNNISIFENIIPNDIVTKIIEKFIQNDIEFILNTPTYRYGSKKLKRKLDNDDKIFNSFDDIKDEHILQIVGETNTFNSMDKLIQIVNQFKDLKVTNLSRAFIEHKKSEKGYYADINYFNTNKGMGIVKFLNYFGFTKDEAICFGDYINDIDMFNSCGTKIAMGNASNELKKIADFVTLTNDESGVGYYIINYILN